MGVQSLWQLLDVCGKPVTLESLENKTLAIDVSIWLNQSIKGYRDGRGNMVDNAHLLTLFPRICKLLFYKIKPVFVFDGTMPLLKKQTLASRRRRKEAAAEGVTDTSRQILENYLHTHAISSLLGDGDAGEDAGGSAVSRITPSTVGQPPAHPTASASPSTHRTQPTRWQPDLFKLPPLPADTKAKQERVEVDLWEERVAQQQMIENEYQDLRSIDIDSAEFRTLPAEIQHELIMEVKERRKVRRRGESSVDMPQDTSSFSSYQMSALLRRSELQQRLDALKREMSTVSAAPCSVDSGQLQRDVTSVLADRHTLTAFVESRRIVSEDNSHYILVKRGSGAAAGESPSHTRRGKPHRLTPLASHRVEDTD